MSDNATKAREYGVSGETAMLLKDDWNFEQCKDFVAQYGRYGDPEPIHVIEKSAYDAIQKQLDEAKAEIEYLNRSLADERSGDCDKDKTIRRITSNNKELEVENTRLREALEVIYNFTEPTQFYRFDKIMKSHDFIEEALKKEGRE